MSESPSIARFHVPAIYPKRLVTVLLGLFKLAQLQVAESSGVTMEVSIMKGRDNMPANVTAKKIRKTAH